MIAQYPGGPAILARESLPNLTDFPARAKLISALIGVEVTRQKNAQPERGKLAAQDIRDGLAQQSIGRSGFPTLQVSGNDNGL